MREGRIKALFFCSILFICTFGSSIPVVANSTDNSDESNWIITELNYADSEKYGVAVSNYDSNGVMHIASYHSDGKLYFDGVLIDTTNSTSNNIFSTSVSLIFSTNDTIHITYGGSVNTAENVHLNYATHNGNGWQLHGAIPGAGHVHSLVMDNAGNLHLATLSRSVENPEINLVYKTLAEGEINWSSSGASIENVASPQGSIDGIALDINSVNNPGIIYQLREENQIDSTIFATKNGSLWSAEVIYQNSGDSIATEQTSIQFDSNDIPHVAFRMAIDGGYPSLLFASLNNSLWMVETVYEGSSENHARGASMILDSNDKPHFVFKNDANDDLLYATKNNTTFMIEIIDSFGEMDIDIWSSSIIWNKQNQPHVTYLVKNNIGEPSYHFRQASLAINITDPESESLLEGDAWLNLELISWQGNSSTTWDTDGTDMDVQFQVCIDLDGDSDGISPLCTWTEVWNNTLTLSNAWGTTFDLIEDNTTLNITIECWDNDDENDEWGNGPDACDMNPDDDEWRLYYETNWSNITTDTFSGDGSKGNDTQWGNADSTWKVTVSYYGDEDNDMISDNIDFCGETTQGEEVDESGCSVFQYDWDDDGLSNSVDPCPTVDSESCDAIGDYVKTHTIPFSMSGFNPPLLGGSHSSQSWDLSPDGRYAVSMSSSPDNYVMLTADLESGQTHHLEVQGTSDFDVQKLKFSPDGKFLVRHQSDYVFFYTVEQYGTEGFSSNDLTNRISIRNSCPETTNGPATTGLAFTKNSEFVKLKCWYANSGGLEEILVNVSTLEVVSDVEIGSEESGGLFNGYEEFWTESKQIDLIGTMVRQVTDPEHGFTIVRDGESLMVPTGKEIVQFSSTDDGNFLFVMSADRTYGSYASTHNETLEIYDLRTGQSFELDYPPERDNWDSEKSTLHTGKISSNGLRIVVNYDGAWHVYERDQDRDGFGDSDDLCPSLPGDFSGCLEEFFDSDNDGINDKDDQCPGTIDGINVDSTGCALNQLDSDGDGISDETDQCPNTPAGDSVGLTGCSGSQVDSDGDGIYDSQDNCPNTPSGTTVDSTGCAPNDVVDLDSDGDGVRDSIDTCPNSATGIIVDPMGCETRGDVQELEDEVSTDASSDALYGFIGLLVVVGIIAAAVAGIKSLFSSSDDGYDWDYDSYSSVSNQTISAPQSEPNLELQNVVAELERQRMQSEREMNQLRQQQAQQSSASEIAAMQREMQALQQRVADSEQAKLQLQNEIEQVKIQKDESINMQDSVVGGDMVASGGQKIESQTNVMGTDPEAIARIIFEAQEKERERMRKERND